MIILVVLVSAGCGGDKFYTTSEIELKLDIIPYETEKDNYDLSEASQEFYSIIYIGKLKKGYSTNLQSNSGYYLQLNDAITNVEALHDYLSCYDCDESNYNIFIIADNNTPEKLLMEIEYIIKTVGNYSLNNLYFYEQNKKQKTKGYNRKPSKIEKTYTVEYNRNDYLQFIKITAEDSLNLDWIYFHPIHVRIDIPFEHLFDSKSSIYYLPPRPPSILAYKDDSLTFTASMFENTKVINDTNFFTYTDNNDFNMRREKYGVGAKFSLPYTHKGILDTLIDYEIIDWGFCGTGKYQTILYMKK